MPSPRKRQRTVNWSDEETLHLVQLIAERKHIIRGKFSSAITSEDKKNAWKEIASTLNSVHGGSRTQPQCEKKLG